MAGGHETWPLSVPAAVAAGSAFDSRRMIGRIIHFSGTFVATMQIEGSLDNVNWVATGASPISAPGYRNIEEGWNHLRIRTTSYTSGTPVAILGGFSGTDEDM